MCSLPSGEYNPIVRSMIEFNKMQDTEILDHLRSKKPSRNYTHHTPSNISDTMSDIIAATVGSWKFIIIQTLLLSIWIVLNLIAWVYQWDPYPFIFLNLVLAIQTAYTAPIIMMSQNRQGSIDRKRAEHDYEVNLKAELEIEHLHAKVDELLEKLAKRN